MEMTMLEMDDGMLVDFKSRAGIEIPALDFT